MLKLELNLLKFCVNCTKICRRFCGTSNNNYYIDFDQDLCCLYNKQIPKCIYAKENRFCEDSSIARLGTNNNFYDFVTSSTNSEYYDDNSATEKSTENFQKPARFSRHLDFNLNYYRDFCRTLKSRPSALNPYNLPVIPLQVVKLNDARYFVDNHLATWWSCLQLQLKRIPKTLLSTSIFGLQKLNLVTEGAVLRIVYWNLIEKFAIHIVSDLKRERFSIKSFDIFLKSLLNFQREFQVTLSEDLRTALALGLFELLTLDFNKNRPGLVAGQLGNVLFRCKSLNVKPNAETLLASLDFFQRYLFLIGSGKQPVDILSFVNTIHIGESYLAWNFDPENEYKHFWTNFFQALKQHDQHLPFINSAFLKLYLQNSLLIAAGFGRENDFERILKSHWIARMKQCLKDCDGFVDEMKFILDNLREKYTVDPGRLDDLISSEMVNEIYCFISCDSSQVNVAKSSALQSL